APERPATGPMPQGTAAERGALVRDPFTPAWLRTAFTQTLRTFAGDDGWKVLEMQLEEGQGTMTVKARREKDHVAVSVGFSDPSLRAMAAANTERLQQALQSQY